MKKAHELIATVFGLGHLPLMPGTWGSLGGLALCYLLRGNIFIYITVFIALFVAGVIASKKFEEDTGIDDPSMVVIDEFACMFPVFLFVPMTWLTVVLGLAIYRILDIVKVPPMDIAERLGGGWGVMLDDLIGAIYTNLILQAIVIFVVK